MNRATDLAKQKGWSNGLSKTKKDEQRTLQNKMNGATDSAKQKEWSTGLSKTK